MHKNLVWSYTRLIFLRELLHSNQTKNRLDPRTSFDIKKSHDDIMKLCESSSEEDLTEYIQKIKPHKILSAPCSTKFKDNTPENVPKITLTTAHEKNLNNVAMHKLQIIKSVRDNECLKY